MRSSKGFFYQHVTQSLQSILAAKWPVKRPRWPSIRNSNSWRLKVCLVLTSHSHHSCINCLSGTVMPDLANFMPDFIIIVHCGFQFGLNSRKFKTNRNAPDDRWSICLTWLYLGQSGSKCVPSDIHVHCVVCSRSWLSVWPKMVSDRHQIGQIKLSVHFGSYWKLNINVYYLLNLVSFCPIWAKIWKPWCINL